MHAAFFAVAFASQLTAQPAPLGNCWHIPRGAEPGIATMLDPVERVDGTQPLTIVSGNQFQGGGNAGNQLADGSAVLYRDVHDDAWSEAPLGFRSTSGNNKYFAATIPAAALVPGSTLEYYLRIAYSDHATTFVHGADAASFTTGDEAIARAEPFAVAVVAPYAPDGDVVELVSESGAVARVLVASGHVDVRASEAAAPILVEPATAVVNGRTLVVGHVLASQVQGSVATLTQELGRAAVTTRLTLGTDGVARYEVVDWQGATPAEVSLAIPSSDTERVSGFGEKFNVLDQSGRSVRVVTIDYPGAKGDNAYKVAPWFVSSRGYGFHLETTAESVFDVRATDPERIRVQHLFSTLRYTLDPGPRLADVLARFTARTGRGAVPPPWVLGPWMSSDAWRNGGEVRYVVTRMAEHDIPRAVFVFDSPWERAYNDFTWNEEQFAQPGTYEGETWAGFSSSREMLQFLRGHGWKVVVWMTPFINVSSFDEGVVGQELGTPALYEEAAAAGYFVKDGITGDPLVVTWWKGDGSPIDFTNPAATAWLQDKLRALVDDSDGVIAGFKIDDGEGNFIPLDAQYFDGRTGVEMKNGYTVEYHRAVGEVLGDDGVLFSRSGFPGTERWAGSWAGDNEPNFGADNGLKSVIVAGQTAALSGFSLWSHDVGGYQDTNLSATPANLFMRWAQFGALTPIMQMHRQVALEKQYPWSYGDEALANYRACAQLHTALLPYLLSAATSAHDDGLPLIRPLLLEMQDDPRAWAEDHAYLLGPDLLVAPLVDNDAVERELLLPAGGWIDFFSGERLDGGTTGEVVVWANEDQTRFPLLVREGGVLPMLADDVDSVGDEVPAALSLRAYPSARRASSVVATTRTFWDGTRADLEVSPGAVTLTVTSTPRPLTLGLHAGAPLGVTVNGVAADFTADGGLVQLQLAHEGGAATVVLAYDPVDDSDVDAGVPVLADGGGDDADVDGDPLPLPSCACGLVGSGAAADALLFASVLLGCSWRALRRGARARL